MTIQNLYPPVAPTLLLDFANTKRLDPRITFTRASPATYYDGKTVAKAEENLLLYSQEFDNAAWVKARSVVTTNTSIAPDNTLTADTLTCNADSVSGFFVSQSITRNPTTTYVSSIYFKKGTQNYALVTLFDLGTNFYRTYFNLNTGTVGSTFQNGWTGTSFIFDVGGGWYRCVIVANTTTGTNLQAIYYPSVTGDNDTNVFVDDTGYFWGAQLEQRNAVTAYTPTTTQPITNYIPVLQTAPAGVARFDHNPITRESLGLLVEESRTNLLTYSEQFDNNTWYKGNSFIQKNIVVAPDGSLTGDKLVENSALNIHFISQNAIFTNTVSYTLSIYAKAAERQAVYLNIAGGSAGASFNLSTGVVNFVGGTATTSNRSASIIAVGNGGYRCSLSFTMTETFSSTYRAGVASTATYAGAQESYQGDGYSGIYIWGAQLEVGAFPTSYIKTETTAVNRMADVASMTGNNFSNWFNFSNGTQTIEFTTLHSAGQDTRTKGIFGSGGARLMYINGNNEFGIFNGVDITKTGLVTSQGVLYKGATAYTSSENVATFSGNPSVVRQLGLGSIPNMTHVNIGSDSQSGTLINGHIRKITYYPTRVSNSNLQALTT